MECTRCGGTVTTYRLSGHTAFVCDSCGRVGIEADHRGQAASRETWDEAIRRFYRREDTDRTADAADVDRAATALAAGAGDATDTETDDAESRLAEGSETDTSSGSDSTSASETDADGATASSETDGRSGGSADGSDADDQ